LGRAIWQRSGSTTTDLHAPKFQSTRPTISWWLEAGLPARPRQSAPDVWGPRSYLSKRPRVWAAWAHPVWLRRSTLWLTVIAISSPGSCWRLSRPCTGAYIDCTGDAVLANLCGVDCWEVGRDTPQIMPATLPSLFAGIDWPRFDNYRKENGHEQQGVEVRQAIADGHFTQPDPFLVGMEHVTTASLVGVRESRRIKGEYVLNIADYRARRQFGDQIGVFNKFDDIHPYDTSKEEMDNFFQRHNSVPVRLEPGECFGLPYGILVPQQWTNLWVAGRCASSDVMVHGSIRVQPAASMMGQAAGTAAVQSI